MHVRSYGVAVSREDSLGRAALHRSDFVSQSYVEQGFPMLMGVGGLQAYGGAELSRASTWIRFYL